MGHLLGRVPQGDISGKVDQKCIYNDSSKDKCFHKGQALGHVPIRNDVLNQNLVNQLGPWKSL